MFGSLWHDTRLMNIMALVFSALALVFFVVASLTWVAHRPVFTLTHIELDGQFQHVNRVGVREHALRSMSGNFFTMNLEDTRRAFENVPWVRSASVRRVWPNGLRVNLVEHEVLGYWGDSKLVSRFGDVFVVNLAEAEAQRAEKLPLLLGPVGSEHLVVEQFYRLNRQLKTGGFQLGELRLSDRFAWTAVIDNGLKLELGIDRPEHSSSSQVDLFLRSYPIVMAQMMKKLTVFDLRYPSGFALAGVSR